LVQEEGEPLGLGVADYLPPYEPLGLSARRLVYRPITPAFMDLPFTGVKGLWFTDTPLEREVDQTGQAWLWGGEDALEKEWLT